MNGQGGTIISNYVSSLPTIPVLQKHNKFDYGSNYFFILEKSHLWNGWLQLELRIDPKSLKKGWLQVLVSKKHSIFENTRLLQVVPEIMTANV